MINRYEITIDQAFKILPLDAEFRCTTFLENVQKLENVTVYPVGYILRSTLIDEIASALKVEALGGYPHMPFITGLIISTVNSNKFNIDFERIVSLDISSFR
jgi:hypothetical protein